MRIVELLAKKKPGDIVCIGPDQSLLDMAHILLKHRIGALLVTDQNDSLVGIVSERDIVKALVELADKITSCSVSSVMTKSVIACTPEDDVVTTLATMNKHKIRHMPVLKNGKPLAMLSIREFDAACQHLQSLSHTDELTGLPNRRFFMGALDAEISRHDRTQSALSVAMLDLDKFKQINDNFGHDVGDQVLRRLAEIMNGRLRGYDIVGRLGGEEFGLLFPNTKLADAITVCENLGDEIRACEVNTGSEVINFTASFGVTELDSQSSDVAKVLIKVDEFLYQAKAQGRDCVVSDLTQCMSEMQSSPVKSSQPNTATNVGKI